MLKWVPHQTEIHPETTKCVKKFRFFIHFLFLNELQWTFSQNVYFIISSISLNRGRTKHGIWNIENQKNLAEHFRNIVFQIFLTFYSKTQQFTPKQRKPAWSTIYLHQFSQFYFKLNQTNFQSKYSKNHFNCQLK